LARQIPDGTAHDRAIRSVEVALARDNPEEANHLVKELPDDNQKWSTLSLIAHYWAPINPIESAKIADYLLAKHYRILN